ncbi:MAG TPA: putative porin, partial [Cyclobacteriaceae bacterium]|nr:putative porin [Cyclobacteriaceae bacterium]
ATPELNFSLWFTKHVNLNSQILYTKILENSEDAIQVPDLLVNAQLSYTSIWFNDNLDFQAGVDMHWHQAYFAPSYDPVIQQFYVQQGFQVPAVPVLDLFLNAKIRRARIVVKYNNFLMMFRDYGNIPTPYYPGIRNIIDFGFDWSFYD